MKYLRLKKKRDFQTTLKNGKRIFTGSLTFVYIPSDRTKMAVCVGKKYGKSVKRNRIKRLLREAFRLQADRLAFPATVLLLPRVAEKYVFADFKRDIAIAIKRLADVQAR